MLCYKEDMAQDKRGTTLLRPFNRVKQRFFFSLCCQSARSRRIHLSVSSPDELSWPPVGLASASLLSTSNRWTDWFFKNLCSTYFVFHYALVSVYSISHEVFFCEMSASKCLTWLPPRPSTVPISSLPFCFLSVESLTDARSVQAGADALNFLQWHQESALCQRHGHK